MTDLSPSAQAVLDSFNSYNELVNRRKKIAAALRTAANSLRFDPQLGMTAYGGHAQAQKQILAIADELEGAQG